MDRLQQEQDRLINDTTRHADAQRRTVGFTLQLVLGNYTLALVPLVPQSQRVFGELTAGVALAVVTPMMLSAVLSTLLYRRRGSEDRWYQRSEAVESLLLYCIALILIAVSEIRWSLLWALCPFTGIFWALTKPFHQRLYMPIIIVTHSAMAVGLGLRGGLTDSIAPVLTGLATLATFAVTAQARRTAVLADADRNVLRLVLKERVLETEREKIARELAGSVAQRLERVAKELRAHGEAVAAPLAQAQAALEELSTIAQTRPPDALPRTLTGLAATVERKLRPLCLESRLTVTTAGVGASGVDPEVALATLRISQELVRNAVTHGAAKTLDVALEHRGGQLWLSVRDDGRGLGPQHLAAATGGLRNAQRWAAELGGTLERTEREGGTELRVSMPAALAG